MGDTTGLKTFCSEALALLGASVAEDDGGLLSVSMPPSALDLFEGRPSLRLAFSPEQVDDGVELVVPGSYVLERLIESVRARGETASVELVPGAQSSPSPGVNLENAEARLISSQSIMRDLLLVSFRVSLVSDEDQDRLLSVVIDPATGQQCNIDAKTVLDCTCRACSTVASPMLDKAFESARYAAMDRARTWTDGAQRKIDDRLSSEIARLDQYYAEMLSDAAHGSKSADLRKVQKHREKALAVYEKREHQYVVARQLLEAHASGSFDTAFEGKMAQLREKKRKLAWKFNIDYSPMAVCDAEIRELQQAADLARRIAKAAPPEDRLAELDKERQQALAELRKQSDLKEASQFNPDALAHLQDLSKQLDSEKAQRIAELMDKFELKVAIKPVSASLVRYPFGEFSYAAVSGSDSIPFASWRDLVTGDLHGPDCQCCHGDMPAGFACACGHLACPTCHKTCRGCGKDLCSSCVTHTCAVCHGPVCEDCVSICAECGITGCKRHVTDCPCCGKPVCAKHSSACPICAQRACEGCVDSSGCCKTCQGLFSATTSFPAIEQILSIRATGRWLINESRDGFVFVRKGLRWRAYTVDKHTGEVRSEHTLGILASLRALSCVCRRGPLSHILAM